MSILNNKILFSQIVSVKKKFHNEELLFISYFFETTQIKPSSIIIRDKFIFFLVSNEDYFFARSFSKFLRYKLRHYKVIIVREEKTLLRLIFSFFPDTYIHDIHLKRDSSSKNMVITLFFIFDVDRGIAIGNHGSYINTINFIFNNSVNYQYKDKTRIKIQCKKLFL